MLYESYQKKIKKIAWAISAFVKTLPIILISLAAITVIIITLVAAKGSVGSVNCPDELIYGESIECNAFGLLSDVEFEYCAEGSDEWTLEVPREVGKYLVRAVGTTSFGGKRYSEPKVITINPKVLDVRAESEVIYGYVPNVTAQLNPGESIICDEVSYADAFSSSTTVTPNVLDGHTKVFDENGKDITFCYSLNAITTDIDVLPRSIGIVVEDYNTVYNGRDVVFQKYQIVDGSMVPGDIEQATFTHKQLEVGETINAPTFTAVREINGNLADISHLYSFDVHYGKITVELRPIEIKTADHKETYSGKNIYCNSFTVGEATPLADGHKIEIVSYESVVDYKEEGYSNSMVFKIKDSDGKDVTKNYSLTVIEGIITVEKRPVTVTTATQTRVYDGTALQNDTPQAEGLVENHKASLNVSDEVSFPHITDVGTIKNEFDVIVITNEKGTDVTHNYAITPVFGTLTVTKRPIEVKPEDAVSVYNGGVQHFKTPQILVDLDAGFLDIAGGEVFEILTSTSFENVMLDGETVISGKNEILTFKIYRNGDSEQQDISHNYEVKLEYGAVTIDQRPISVKPQNAGSEYNGLTQYFSVPEIITGEDVLDLVDGHVFEITSSTGFENVMLEGDRVVSGENTILSFKIYKESDVSKSDISFNYNVDLKKGDVIITKKPLKVTTYDGVWTYDGIVHSAKDGTDSNGGKLIGVEGLVSHTDPEVMHQFEIVECSSVYDFKDYDPAAVLRFVDNTATIKVTFGEEDKTFNYEIDYGIPGKLTLHKRPANVITGSNEWTYDGEEHYYIGDDQHGAPTVKVENLVVGHSFEIVEGSWAKVYDFANVESTETKIVIPNSLTVEILNGTDDVTYNYILEDDFGSLTLSKRKISVKPKDGNSEYNGLPQYFKYHQLLIDSDAGYLDLVSGEIFEIVDSTEFENVMLNGDTVISGKNEILSFIIYKESDTEKTDISYNYIVDRQEGKVTITKKPLKVTTYDGVWTYDGKTHSSLDEIDSKGNTLLTVLGLVEHLELNVKHEYRIEEYSSVTDFAGQPLDIASMSVDNTVKIKILMGEEDKTDNYDIDYGTPGSLTLNKRRISVKPKDGISEYNGLPQYFKDHQLLIDSDAGYLDLVSGEIFEIVDSTEFENVMLNGDAVISGKNEILSFIIYKESDTEKTDISYNYIVDRQEGKVTITKKPLKVTTYDGVWTYDGKTHSVLDEIDSRGNTLLTVLGLVEHLELNVKHEYRIEEYSSVTDFAGQPLDITSMSVDNTVKIKVLCGGLDKTSNYDIDYGTPGKLTLCKRHITIETEKNHSVIYDAQPHSFTNFRILNTAQDEGLVDGHKFVVRKATTLVNVAEPVDNVFTEYVICLSDDSEEKDIKYNYVIDFKCQTVKLLPRPITIRTASAEKEYDGTYLVKNSATDWKITDGMGLIDDGIYGSHQLTVTFDSTAAQKIPGETKNTFTWYITDKLFGGDVSGNYVVTPDCGTLKINKVPVKLGVSGVRVKYDALLHKVKLVAMKDKTRNDLNVNVIDFTYGITNVGTVLSDEIAGLIDEHLIISVQKDTDGDGIFDLSVPKEYCAFTVNKRGNEIAVEISKRYIELTVDDVSRSYDGYPLTAKDYTITKQDDPISGHYIDDEVLIISGEVVGSFDSDTVGIAQIVRDSVVIRDAEGNQYTNNYEIVLIDGTITVYKADGNTDEPVIAP